MGEVFESRWRCSGESIMLRVAITEEPGCRVVAGRSWGDMNIVQCHLPFATEVYIYINNKSVPATPLFA